MDRRTSIGIVSVGMVAISLVHYVFQPAFYTWQPMAAGGLRIGLLMGLFWLAYPDLDAVPGWLWGCLLTGGVLIAWRPRLAIFVLPLMGILWMLKRR